MLARLVFLSAFLASLIVTPVAMQQSGGSNSSDQGKDLVMTRSAEPTGKSLYTNSHALIIGVNSYPNLPKNLQLKFAVADATALRDMLVGSYGFDPSSVTLLTNEKATLANIRRELSQLASSRKVDADDRILIYFSGHGQTVKLPAGGEMGFLIPSDGKIDMDDPNDAGPYLETCLPMKQVWDYLASSPAKHACVIADACFSGMMATSRSIGMSTDTVNAMLARPARQVLTAGSIGQKTFERPDLGHGVFTYKLLEELKARAADPGKVFSLMDLYMSLQSSVSNLTAGKQIPQFGSVETEGQMLFCSGTALVANNTSTTGGGTEGGTGGVVKPPATTKATLTITSTPAGATLFVDGQKKGSTPYSMQVDLKNAGEKTYQIRLQAEGYIPVETSATLKPGDDLSIPIELKKVPVAPPPVTTAKILIESNPVGATVLVDGKKVGVTPYTLSVDLKSAPERQVKVEVTLAGYVSAQTVTTVKRGDSLSVPFDLQKVEPVSKPPKRDVKKLTMSPVTVLGGKVPVAKAMFSPDGKQLAVSGLDASLTLYNASGGAARKVDAPKNTIVRITPDWSKILFIRILTDNERTWVSVQPKDAKTLADIGAPIRIGIRPETAIEDAYAGNNRLLLCGSIGRDDARTGFVTIADFKAGQAKTLTGGYRMGQPTSSADDSKYAVYVEPTDLRAPGSILVFPSDLTQEATSIETKGCNSAAGIRLSDDGRIVATTCQRITNTGAEILGTKIFEVGSGKELHELPKIRVAAFVGNGSRILGWRSQIGGPIIELLDVESGNGLGETAGGEIWLSSDEKLAAQASPEGVISIFRLDQPR